MKFLGFMFAGVVAVSLCLADPKKKGNYRSLA